MNDGRRPVGPHDRALYVHFPYCAKKCPYCDFNSHAVDHDDRRYADAILSEMDRHTFDGPLASIFFGGGTPSRWAPEQVGRVIEGARTRFGFVEEIEITLEANPGTVAESRMFAFVRQGINRFSIGVQSFDDSELSRLGRIHGASAAETAVGIAKRTGARTSLDLIYALPGQSWNDVRRTLERALALGTDHISAYTLTIEPDTTLGRKTARGLFIPMTDDHQADLIERVTELLRTAGYERYEISNYARPGQASRHNLIYWVGGYYLGLGAGAHSYLPAPSGGAIRRSNVKKPELYLSDPGREDLFERLDRREALSDRLMVGLRTRWGLNLEELPLEGDEEANVMSALDRLQKAGLVLRDGNQAKPTDRGFLMNDTIARTLLTTLQDHP